MARQHPGLNELMDRGLLGNTSPSEQQHRQETGRGNRGQRRGQPGLRGREGGLEREWAHVIMHQRRRRMGEGGGKREAARGGSERGRDDDIPDWAGDDGCANQTSLQIIWPPDSVRWLPRWRTHRACGRGRWTMGARSAGVRCRRARWRDAVRGGSAKKKNVPFVWGAWGWDETRWLDAGCCCWELPRLTWHGTATQQASNSTTAAPSSPQQPTATPSTAEQAEVPCSFATGSCRAMLQGAQVANGDSRKQLDAPHPPPGTLVLP